MKLCSLHLAVVVVVLGSVWYDLRAKDAGNTPSGPGAGASQGIQSIGAEDSPPEGLSLSDGSSIRVAYEAGRHAFQPVEGGWQARNPGQQWTTRFDGRGFVATPRDGGWTWGLELRSYGFGDKQTIVGNVSRACELTTAESIHWRCRSHQHCTNEQQLSGAVSGSN